MNLRKSRYSFGQKRNSSCKDFKSLVEKKKTSKHSENSKSLYRNLPKTPVKNQKPILDGILTVRTPNINLVTSTPIPCKIRKTISRTLNGYNSNEISELNSLKRISCSITSTPIQKNFYGIKPCEVKLIPVAPRGRKYSFEKQNELNLRSNKKSSNSQSSHFSFNSSTEILRGKVQSTKNNVTLHFQNGCKQVPGDTEMPLSRKLRSARKISITSKKKLSKSKKTGEKLVVPQDELSLCNKKGIKKPLTSRDVSSVLDKSKKSFDAEIFQQSRNSFHETDNLTSSRYNLRNSLSVTENKCLNYSDKQSYFSSTPKNSSSAIKKSNRVPRRQKDSINVEVSEYSEVSLTKPNSGTENSKPFRCSLRLQIQRLSATASSNELSSKKNQNISKTKKGGLKPSSGIEKSSRYSLRLSERQSSKKSTDSNLSLKQTTSVKKQKLAKNGNQNKAAEWYKETASISKKQMLQRKSADKYQRKFLSFTGNIPIDDLALSARCEKRKIKSDGFKLPGKNTLKRKLSAIQAVIKADEDYEDDLYESKKFDIFKELLMDTSDSETSFAISTPKLPNTPLVRHKKTPKFKDCYSPGQYAISRKAAIEYIYRNRKSGEKPSEIPVIAEKKKLEYSQVLDDVQKFKKSIDNLAEEESDNDSYFSFG